MLYAVIGSRAGKSRDDVMAIYPRHKAFLDQFISSGEVEGVGPFTDPEGGNMALFRSREAAEELVVSKRTVDFHLANIYDKLQVNNRVQAFRAATRLGLIPFEPSFGLIRGEG